MAITRAIGDGGGVEMGYYRQAFLTHVAKMSNEGLSLPGKATSASLWRLGDGGKIMGNDSSVNQEVVKCNGIEVDNQPQTRQMFGGVQLPRFSVKNIM